MKNNYKLFNVYNYKKLIIKTPLIQNLYVYTNLKNKQEGEKQQNPPYSRLSDNNLDGGYRVFILQFFNFLCSNIIGGKICKKKKKKEGTILAQQTHYETLIPTWF